MLKKNLCLGAQERPKYSSRELRNILHVNTHVGSKELEITFRTNAHVGGKELETTWLRTIGFLPNAIEEYATFLTANLT